MCKRSLVSVWDDMRLNEIALGEITITITPKDAVDLSHACGAAALINQGEPPDEAYFAGLGTSAADLFALYTALSVAFEAMGAVGTASRAPGQSLTAFRQPVAN